VPRIWMEGKNLPGLAISRSFGDKLGQEIGVISVPELCELTLMEQEKFLILASDGLWAQVSNKEAIDMVWPFYLSNNAELAA